MTTTREAINGKPYEENPYVRFGEEGVTLARPGRGSLLHSRTAVCMRKKIFALSSLIISSCHMLSAETYTWTGAGEGGNWNDRQNWSPATGCPNSGDTAVFAASANITSAISLSEGVLNIQLQSGVTNDFSGVISGPGGISVTGANIREGIDKLIGGSATWRSAVRLNAANTFSGGISGTNVALEGWNTAAFGAENSGVSVGGTGWLGFCAAGDWRRYSYVIENFESLGMSVYFSESAEIYGTFMENGITANMPRLFLVTAKSSPDVVIHGDMELPSIVLLPNIYGLTRHLKIDGILNVKGIRGGAWIGGANGYLWLTKPGGFYGSASIGYSVQFKCLAENVLDGNAVVLWDGYRSERLSDDERVGNLDLNGFSQKAVALSTTQDQYAMTGDSYLRNTSSSSATLTLQGATQDYLANCAIKDPLSIVWNPEMAVTQTVHGIKDHTMSGGIAVSNGAFRITGPAGFAQVSHIDIAAGASFVCGATTAGALAGVSCISIGAGGSFIVDDGAANPFPKASASLDIDSSAEIAVPSTMTLAVATLAVGGVPYGHGTYSSDPSAPNHLPQLKGGVITVSSDIALDTVEAVWTADGANPENPSDAGNWSWEDAGVPPLAVGSLYPKFADDGERITIDDNADFKGIRFAGAAGRFDIAGPGMLTVRSLGITADAQRTNRIDAHVRCLGSQKWTVGAGSVLEIGGGISDIGGGAELVKDGKGRLILDSPSEFTGPVTLGDGSSNAGEIMVTAATNALGLASDHPLTINSIKGSSPAQGVFRLACTTGVCHVERPVVFKNSDIQYAFRSESYTTNVFTRPLVADGTLRFFFDKYSEVICLGGGSFGGWTCFSGDGRAKWIFRETPVSFNYLYMSAGSRLHLDVASNHVGGVEFPSSGVNELFAEVPFALASDVTKISFSNSGSRINISGGDQRVGSFKTMSGGAVTSSVPAVLEVTQTVDITNDGVYFLGAAGLFKLGAGRLTFPLSQTSSGAVGVGEGTLAFTDGATWANSTNITVNGTGVLEISSSETFSPNCEMHISGNGKVRIAAGVVQRVRHLYIDGKPVGVGGLFGGVDSSGDKRFSGYLEGKGLLKVKGIGSCRIIIR